MAARSLVVILLVICATPYVAVAQVTQTTSPFPCASQLCETFSLAVECEGLPPRNVWVREWEVASPWDVNGPEGALILTSDGKGGAFYAGRAPGDAKRRETIDGSRTRGFHVFEISWQGDDGWATDVAGAGYKATMCGYAGVVRWLEQHRMAGDHPICAHGNSGGGAQIAYGLSVYGLDELLDMVILTGGPPMSRVDIGCFDSGDAAYFNPTDQGRKTTDIVHGWLGRGDYCQSHNPLSPPPDRHMWRLERESLASMTDPAGRAFHFPATKVNFVSSAADPAGRQGRIYHDLLTGPKDGHVIQTLPSEKAHDVPNTIRGAERIRQLIVDECTYHP